MPETITYHVEDHIAYLCLAKPPKNEMSLDFFREFDALMEQIERDKALRGLIIYSEGRHFSSGANTAELIELFADNSPEIPQIIAENSRAFRRMHQLSIPVIACLKGICYGAGLELALSAHIRIAAPNTRMSFPEAGFDIMPGLGGLTMLTEIAGAARAMELILSTDSLTAEEAQAWGLIDIFADKQDLVATAKKLIAHPDVESRTEND